MTDRLESAEAILKEIIESAAHCDLEDIKAHFAKYQPDKDAELRERWDKITWPSLAGKGGLGKYMTFDMAKKGNLLATQEHDNRVRCEVLDVAHKEMDKLLNIKYFQKNTPANIKDTQQE